MLWNIGILLGDTVGYDPDVHMAPLNESFDRGNANTTPTGVSQRNKIARMLYNGQVTHFVSVFLVINWIDLLFGFVSFLFVFLQFSCLFFCDIFQYFLLSAFPLLPAK